jgi:YidC/Oxa1 family membrane protein insertase
VDNILDSCLDPLLESLLATGHRVILRPHPQYVRIYPDKMSAILNRYADRVGDDLIIQTDFSSTDTVYSADLLITDWSNIGYEFALSTLKPVLYINTPMKVMNADWDKIDVVPFDIRIRSQIGAALELSEVSQAGATALDLLARADEYRDLIRNIRETEIFHLGTSAKVGADYVIRRCEELRLKREAEEEDDDD